MGKFRELFKHNLIEVEEEKYLYSKLYGLELRKVNGKHNEILNILESRANNYALNTLWWNILQPLIEGMKEENIVFSDNVNSYINIMSVLTNKDDPNYKNTYIESFKKAF